MHIKSQIQTIPETTRDNYSLFFEFLNSENKKYAIFSPVSNGNRNFLILQQ